MFPHLYYQNASGGNTQRLKNDSFSLYDFTYDAAGNVTGANGVQNYYTWDYANRLTGFNGKTYDYDTFGRKSTTANGSTTRYIGVSGNTVGERNTTTGVATDYIFGPGIDEPLAKRTANGSITYFGVDGLGSLVVSTDLTGAVLSSTGYSPWGETVTTPELFGYTGRETGGPSWYYRARHYDAAHGRFLSEDPLGGYLVGNPMLSSHLNRTYGYVENNPVIRRDPMGLNSCGPLPPCGNSVPCGQCCAQRFQWGLCAMEETFRYSHVYELGATAAGALAGGTRGLGGALLGAGIGLAGSSAYFYYAQAAAEQAIRNAYQRCVDQCKNERLLACNLPPLPPGPLGSAGPPQ